MRRITCLVTRSELAKDQRDYPPWEVPLLKLVHGGQVKELGETRCEERVPNPYEEYMRLERRFGRDRETQVSRVGQIYGMGDVGVQNLAHAMQADLDEQEEMDKADAKAEKKRVAAGAAAE